MRTSAGANKRFSAGVSPGNAFTTENNSPLLHWSR